MTAVVVGTLKLDGWCLDLSFVESTLALLEYGFHFAVCVAPTCVGLVVFGLENAIEALVGALVCIEEERDDTTFSGPWLTRVEDDLL